MLASMAAPGTDIVLTEDRILSYRAFANKIWNAARFVFMNLEKYEAAGANAGRPGGSGSARMPRLIAVQAKLRSLDRWIFSRLSRRRRAGERRARTFPFS